MDSEDLQDIVTKAMRKSFQLGQTYWQQADSESYSQNAKSDVTYQKFLELINSTVEQIKD